MRRRNLLKILEYFYWTYLCHKFYSLKNKGLRSHSLPITSCWSWVAQCTKAHSPGSNSRISTLTRMLNYVILLSLITYIYNIEVKCESYQNMRNFCSDNNGENPNSHSLPPGLKVGRINFENEKKLILRQQFGAPSLGVLKVFAWFLRLSRRFTFCLRAWLWWVLWGPCGVLFWGLKFDNN